MFMKLTKTDRSDTWVWFDRGTTMERHSYGTAIHLGSGWSVNVEEKPEEIIARLFPSVVPL